MSRKRNKRAARRLRLSDVQAVLAGRVAPEPEARALVELIRAVNPTDRTLPAAEAKRRYADKSRLQSLLVRRFADELEALPEADEAVVLLRYGPSGRSACHAVLEELDDDAQRWVRQALDAQLVALEAGAGDGGGAAKARSAAGGADAVEVDDADEAHRSPQELITRAEQALAEYDFPAAQRRLARALDASGGARAAAQPLLELLVDTLAADAEALDLQARLSPEAAGDAGVRVLLGLAAARQGEAGRAEALVRGLSHVRVVEVHAALADGALAAGQLDVAEQHLAAARSFDLPSQALLHIEEALAAQRAGARQPEERALSALVEAGQLEQAEQAAAALLERYPDSVVARRVRAAVQRQRAEAAQEALCGAVDRELAEQRFEQAAALLRAAGASGADLHEAQLARRMARAEAGVQVATEAAQVARVLALLDAVDATAEGQSRGQALAAYVALEPEPRRRVREAAEAAQERATELSQLEALGASSGSRVGGGSDKRARAAVDAVLALGRAEVAAAHQEWEAARELLEPHARQLDRLPRGAKLLAEAAARVREQATSRAAEALARAEAAAAAGELEQAEALLARIDRRRLDAGRQGDAEALSARLRQAGALAELGQRVARQERSGDLLGARQTAEALIAQTQGAARETWRARRAALSEAIGRRFVVVAGAREAGARAHPVMRLRSDGAIRLLSADGDELVLIDTQGRYLALELVAVESSEVRRSALLRTPSPIGICDAALVGDALQIVGDEGVALDLSLEGFEPRRWVDLRAVLGRDCVFEDMLVADGRHAWVATQARTQAPITIQVVDLERRRVVRELPQMIPIQLIPGARPGDAPLVGGHRDEERGPQLYTTRGRPRRSMLPRDLELQMATPRPDGAPGLLVLHTESLLDVEHEGPLHLTLFDAQGRAGPALRLEGSSGAYIHSLACSVEQGLAFVAFLIEVGERQQAVLVALRPRGETLELVWRVKVPRDLNLVQDAAAYRVASVVREEGDLRVLRLSAAPPALEALAARERLGVRDLPLLTSYCGPSRSEADDAPRGELRRAGDHVAAGQWAEARAICEALDGAYEEKEELSEADEQHRLHLQGIERFVAGDVKAARRLWELAGELQGSCKLELWLDAAGPLPDPLPDPLPMPQGAGPSETCGRGRWLLASIRDADEALARGAYEEVVSALGRDETVWRVCEVQSLARLAAAHLALAARGAQGERAQERERGVGATFERGLALAALVAAAEKEGLRRHEVAVPGAMWGRGKVAEVVEGARGWLSEEA
jgi:hypothetical protein